MTTSRNPYAFVLPTPDPAIVLPTLASSKHGAEARQATVGGLLDATATLGQMRPIPSLIALRGLVGLPDPAATPDYSALQALTGVRRVERTVAAAQTRVEPPEPVEALAPARTGAAIDAPSRRCSPPSTAASPPTAILETTADFLGVPPARIADLLHLAQTSGAVVASAARGVRLETTAGDRWVLRKPAPAHEGMNDFVAGMLSRAALVDPPWVLPLALHGATWLASPQVEGAIDLDDFARRNERDADDNGGKAESRSGHPVPTGQPLGRDRTSGCDPASSLARAFAQSCGKGLEAQVAFAMLVGSEDLHSGHFGVVLDSVENKDGGGGEGEPERKPPQARIRRVVRLDGPLASRDRQRLHRIRSDYFDHQMHPAPTPRRATAGDAHAHRLDVPRDLRCSARYIDALLVLSRLDLSNATRLAFAEAARHWSDDVCRAFATQANLRLPTRRWTTTALFEECGRAYLQRISARQSSMQRYAADLAIGLASVDARSNILRLTPCRDTHDEPATPAQATAHAMAIDRFLGQPETRPAIEAWLHRSPGAARQRNPLLDRHDVALRAAVAERLAVTES